MNAEAVVAVVDDTPENIRVLRQLLAQAGYKVLCFTNGEAAVKAFIKRPPDIVLMDVNMPGTNGCEACEKMKKDEALSDIPVVFISALSESEDIIHGFKVGGADYIVKPFRAEEVLARVNTHVTNHKLKKSLKERNEQLVQLESMRDNLVHMIAHDIRSPLAFARGFAELCERRITKGEVPPVNDVKRISHGCQRISNMLNDMLSVSQMEEHGFKPTKDYFDVSIECAQTIEQFKLMNPKHIFSTKLPKGKVVLNADKEIVLRIIENLLSNAVKFTPSGEVITLEIIEEQDNSVKIIISDQGPGIPDVDKEKIFEKYCQLQEPDSRYKGSVGLGLTFCKLATDAHGGSIGIDDTPSGGSSFWIKLPGS